MAFGSEGQRWKDTPGEILGWVLSSGTGGNIVGGIIVVLLGVLARRLFSSRVKSKLTSSYSPKGLQTNSEASNHSDGTPWDRLDSEAEKILLAVADEMDPPTIGTIAQVTNFHFEKVRYHLRRLIQDDLIQSFSSPSSYVHLTTKGGRYLVENELI
jgi:hypothetical protein